MKNQMYTRITELPSSCENHFYKSVFYTSLSKRWVQKHSATYSVVDLTSVELYGSGYEILRVFLRPSVYELLDGFGSWYKVYRSKYDPENAT
uniref:Uncharacterized protein n=1 Tax=Romanomermis culicivorax TaxID=13658 RepID=A0A915K6X4_ROMCU